MSIRLFLFIIALTGYCGTALAWGPQGHALIADIAEAHLNAQAQSGVSRLLASESHHGLDQIASWADEFRHKQRRTGRWHYVDIPLHARGYKARRDCRQGNCVVARITYFAHILANRSASEGKRLRALKFVVHLIGDVHQPLHATSNHDAGGNDVKINYFGHPTNLHAIWDSAIIDRALHLHVGWHYSINRRVTRKAAKRVGRSITTRDQQQWTRVLETQGLKQATIHWANQSHALARDVAYADLPQGSKKNWSAYQRRAWAVEKRQLQRGGIRLAATLNTIFDQTVRF